MAAPYLTTKPRINDPRQQKTQTDCSFINKKDFFGSTVTVKEKTWGLFYIGMDNKLVSDDFSPVQEIKPMFISILYLII